MKATEDQKL